MGLFGKSESDKIGEEIRELVGEINHNLRELQNILNRANLDVIYSDGAQINLCVEEISRRMERMQPLYNSLSPSKQSQLMVPWIDGRYWPLPIWHVSFVASMKDIERIMENRLNL